MNNTFEIEQITDDLYKEHIVMRRAISRIAKISMNNLGKQVEKLPEYQKQVDRWLRAHIKAMAIAHALSHLTNESEEVIYQKAYDYVNRNRD